MCGAKPCLLLLVKPCTQLPTVAEVLPTGRSLTMSLMAIAGCTEPVQEQLSSRPVLAAHSSVCLCLQDPEASLSNLQKLVFSTTGVRTQHQRLVVEGEHSVRQCWCSLQSCIELHKGILVFMYAVGIGPLQLLSCSWPLLGCT